MKYIPLFLLFVSIGCGLNLFCTDNRHYPSFQEIEQGFQHIPDSIQTSAYWYWISDHLSKEGVIADLKAMKKVGINRAFIGNISIKGMPRGKVRLFSDEWWEILHTALKTATELDIEIGIFNSPGWSQSGGPWVKPNQAMRYLAAIDTVVAGPMETAIRFPERANDFEDVRVVAFKLPPNADKTLADFSPSITTASSLSDITHLMDGDVNTAVTIPAGQTTSISFNASAPFTARSVAIHPGRNRSSKMSIALEAEIDGQFKLIKKFELDKLNNKLRVGFEQFAPVVESFPDVSATTFRFKFSAAFEGSGIAEISLNAAPKIARFKEKTLARMHPTPLAYWEDYLWPRQDEVADPGLLVDEAQVVDISSSFDTTTQLLKWTVPPGEWKILRTGMTPTGVTNSPASPEGTGLEIDKMNHQHVISHFDAFLGEIIRRIPAEDRKTWKVVVQDSYETGGQNWTDDFEQKFQRAFGYSPIPYIPALYGYVVGSQDQSDRFLWDLRRFVADCIAYEYVGGLRDVSHKYGLRTWLENYGHWGFPGEFLQYGGQSDELGGEFWSEGELGDIENRAASSAAHIYGKVKVSAESFTASGKTYARYPAMFKQRGDRFFAEGINNTLLHVYIHQPYENRKPGVNAWFGNEFNRFNTWYSDMDMFVDYLKRCNFLLQQGNYVADVAYFIGEDAPKMTGEQTPPLPKGHSFDYINGEVILNRLDVKDGKFVLPDGMQYKVLALPPLETMRPAILEKIVALVKKGGTVLGPRPTYSPSLTDYGNADSIIREMAADLWGNIDGKTIKTNTYGKGLVMDGMDLNEVFSQLQLLPDMKTQPEDPVVYIHRTLPDGELYFVSNQKDSTIHIEPVFRAEGASIELWDAVTGKIRTLPEYTVNQGTTEIPLVLDAFESAFIIFRKEAPAKPANLRQKNFPEPIQSIDIDGPWQVRFDNVEGGSENGVVFDTLIDWSKHPNKNIAHYAGSATYGKTIAIDDLTDGYVYKIDLGKVIALAKVTVNGQPVGGVWTPPYEVDISQALRNGENKIEITVTNTWANRLIGDQQLPAEDRTTWALFNQYTAQSPLEPAGLLGPVSIAVYE